MPHYTYGKLTRCNFETRHNMVEKCFRCFCIKIIPTILVPRLYLVYYCRDVTHYTCKNKHDVIGASHATLHLWKINTM